MTNILNKWKKEFKGHRALSLIEQNAEIKSNKLESVPFNITDSSVQTVLENSEFETVRAKLGHILSIYGESLMIVLPYKNTFIVDALQVTNYEKIGKFNIVLEGYSGACHIHDGNEYMITTKLYFKDGKPTLTRYWINEEDEYISYGEDYVFENMDTLPGELFKNNFKHESDVDFARVRSALMVLDYHDSKLKAEWERTRTLPIYNENFTDNDPVAYTKAIDNGQGFLNEDGFGAKMGAGTQMMPATAGTAVLQSQIVFLEDDIKAKLGMSRDTVNSGSNNHNLEVIMANEFGTESLLQRKKIRELHWNSFFAKLAQVLNVSEFTVEVILSEIEGAKIKLLEATVMEAQVKAQNISAQDNAAKAKSADKEEE